MKRPVASVALITFAFAAAISRPALSGERANWTQIWSDRNVVVARDIGARVETSSDGTRKYRLAVGFKTAQKFAETPTLNAATADFVLLHVRVQCDGERVEYLDALAMMLAGSGGGPLNKYFENSNEFGARLPAQVGKAVITGTCSGRIGKQGYSAMTELLADYRRR